MKKIFSVWVCCALLVFSCTAQKIKMPKAVSDAFATKFPEAKEVKWGKESATEYEAEFKVKGQSVSANFDATGKWVETESTIALSDLPPAVVAAVKGKFPNAEMTGAEKVDQPGKSLYEVLLKSNGRKKSVELTPEGVFTE
ncbi:MAG: hypothetical protein GC171_13720 [Terrimonas sp.]|nr:hypothetical protein [Terrimonas sp.]